MQLISGKDKKSSRNFGFLLTALIGIGSTLGGGIFVLIPPAASHAGAFVPLSFLIAGLFAIGVAIVYAEITFSGEEEHTSVSFIFSAYGKGLFGFLVTWLVILGDLGYLALHVLGFAQYSQVFLPLGPGVIASILVAFVVWLHIRGFKKERLWEIISVILILGLFGAFFYMTGSEIDFGAATEGWSFGSVPFIGIFAAIGLIFSSFVRYQDIASLSGKVKQPQKTVRWALIVSVIFSTLLFAALSFVAVQGLTPDELVGSTASLFHAAEKIGGGIAPWLVLVAALLATLTSTIAMFMVVSRKMISLAEERFFRSLFKKKEGRALPVSAVIFSGVIALFFVFSNSVALVAYITNASYLILLVVLSIAVIRMRIKRPFMERLFRIKLFPLLPLTVALFSLLLLLFIGLDALLITALWAFVGFIVYLVSWIKKERIPWILAGVIGSLLVFIGIFIYGFIA